jgi:hypothetical protein
MIDFIFYFIYFSQTRAGDLDGPTFEGGEIKM